MEVAPAASGAAPGMVPLNASERLLLLQAVYREGSSGSAFEAVSRLLLAHPETRGRQRSSLSPAACLQHYRSVMAAGNAESSSLPADAKRQRSRSHLKMARRLYAERLVEVRDQLAEEEATMRTLLQEMEDIQNGGWDDRLTASYILLEASGDPARARYAHVQSAAVQETVRPTEGAEAALLPTSPVRRSSRSSRSPTRKSAVNGYERDAEPESAITETANNEAQSAADTVEPFLPEDAAATEAIQTGPTADQTLADIPEEVEETESLRPTTSKPTKSSNKSTAKPPISERRSSTRASRSSISNMADIAPSSGEGTSAAGLNVEDLSDRVASPKSAPMELDSSRESQPSTSNTRKGSRGARRSSLPRDTNKRKRATTPLDVRGPSPAISDRSRSKRVKTEEPESSVGTPAAEQDRTPFASEAAARRFRNSAPLLVSQMQGNIRSNFFKDPVKASEAINYYDIVKRPMDLKTLLANCRGGRVSSTAEFKRDVALIFANAVMYNGPHHDVGRDAIAMWGDVQSLFKVLEQAEQRAG